MSGRATNRPWWRGGGRGVRTEVTDAMAVRDIAPRRVTVYLPPGYDRRRARPYPLLVALDGQTMPQWRLGETLGESVLAGRIEPVVVAAVPAAPARLEEYGTAGALDFAGRGRLARAFQELLAGVVLPGLRERYHLAAAPAATGIFGASMGGLAAFDTAWRRPRIFGLAGIFSGSLWWRADDSSPAAQQASRIAHAQVAATPGKPALRLWFEAGTRDEAADRDGNGVIDAIQDTVELVELLAGRGFQRGAELAYRQIEGGEHHESTWARALPEFLAWAFPPRAG